MSLYILPCTSLSATTAIAHEKEPVAAPKRVPSVGACETPAPALEKAPSVTLFLRGNTFRFLLPFTESELLCIFSILGKESGYPHATVELELATDAAMATLNENALGCPSSTNILSFPLGAVAAHPQQKTFTGSFNSSPLHLGSLVAAPMTIERERWLYQDKAESYWIRLLTHGFVHLLGYDHGQEMNTLCEKLETSVHATLT